MAWKVNLYRGYLAICNPDDHHLSVVCTVIMSRSTARGAQGAQSHPNPSKNKNYKAKTTYSIYNIQPHHSYVATLTENTLPTK